MSVVDLQRLRKLEESSFLIPPGLAGRVFSSELELRQELPITKKHGPVRLKEHQPAQTGIGTVGMDIYARMRMAKPGITENVAYGCPQCGKIVLGSPRIEIEDTMDEKGGREALHYHCKECNVHLYERVFAVS